MLSQWKGPLSDRPVYVRLSVAIRATCFTAILSTCLK